MKALFPLSSAVFRRNYLPGALASPAVAALSRHGRLAFVVLFLSVCLAALGPLSALAGPVGRLVIADTPNTNRVFGPVAAARPRNAGQTVALAAPVQRRVSGSVEYRLQVHAPQPPKEYRVQAGSGGKRWVAVSSGGAGVAPTRVRGAALPDAVPADWQSRIHLTGARHGLDEALLAAVIRVESNFNARAVSPKGALGAMQIMPDTGKLLGLENFFDPDANVDAGARYLSSLINQFPRLDDALAAYNAGPGAVLRHGGTPPFAETRNYVDSVLLYYRLYGQSGK
jgi:hypothetical protein